MSRYLLRGTTEIEIWTEIEAPFIEDAMEKCKNESWYSCAMSQYKNIKIYECRKLEEVKV